MLFVLVLSFWVEGGPHQGSYSLQDDGTAINTSPFRLEIRFGVCQWSGGMDARCDRCGDTAGMCSLTEERGRSAMTYMYDSNSRELSQKVWFK